jgi:hypothetical protein
MTSALMARHYLQGQTETIGKEEDEYIIVAKKITSGEHSKYE